MRRADSSQPVCLLSPGHGRLDGLATDAARTGRIGVRRSGRRTAADVVLLSYAIVNYVVIASTTSTALFYPRYALPIIVVLALLSGRLLADLLRARVAHALGDRSRRCWPSC